MTTSGQPSGPRLRDWLIVGFAALSLVALVAVSWWRHQRGTVEEGVVPEALVLELRPDRGFELRLDGPAETVYVVPPPPSGWDWQALERLLSRAREGFPNIRRCRIRSGGSAPDDVAQAAGIARRLWPVEVEP